MFKLLRIKYYAILLRYASFTSLININDFNSNETKNYSSVLVMTLSKNPNYPSAV
jgi:hypothetical protein